ncbi:MAG: hypothetical protein HY001_03990 [Candidatus Portnoybacteria bacterium]|nr:hypothetical protein [Candidatus Portnoybacteria bacterium]
MLVFVTIAFAGFTILVMALLFGGDHDFGDHEVSFEHDFDHEAGHEHETDTHGPSPFSVRVISLFATAFGASGAIASYCGYSTMGSSLIGVMSGFVIGGMGWQFMRLLWSQQASSTVSQNEMVGQVAEVTTPIPSSGVGEVSFLVRGQRFYRSARSEVGLSIEGGKTVKIVAFPSDVAVVRQIDRAL